MEVRLGSLERKVDDLDGKIEKLDGKIDELLALRNQGLGVFWLVSGLLGTGIVGMFFQLTSWFRGN